MDQQEVAEKQYQQGLFYAHSTEGSVRENLERAVISYKLALQYYTPSAYPRRWEQIQQDLAEAYSELAQERLKRTQEVAVAGRGAWRPLRISRVPILLLVVVVILLVPTTAIATAYLTRNGPTCVNGSLNIDGSTVLQQFVNALAQEYMKDCPGARIIVGGGASKTGLADVEQGHAVISGVQSKEDQARLSGRDVPIEIGDSDIFAPPALHDLIDHQVAIGVFVVLVNSDVTNVHNITTEQIQGIYTGVYQNWKQVCDGQKQCGPDLPIVPISRTTNSGTRFTFEKYILKGVATVPGIGLNRVSSSDDAVQEVQNNPGSIGYAPLSLAENAQHISILSIDGQDPHNSALIQRDGYQFWNIEHMYTRGQGSALAQAFIAYMYSDAANQLLARYQFLHLNDISQAIRDRHILESDPLDLFRRS